MWNSQESERRLREPTGGRRARCGAVSSSTPPRPNLPGTGPADGLANRILGAEGFGEGLEEPVPPIEPAIDVGNVSWLALIAAGERKNFTKRSDRKEQTKS